MSLPDDLKRRGFQMEAGNHRHEAARSLALVIQRAQEALHSLDGDVRTDALRHMAQYAAEAVAHGNALSALRRVERLMAEDS